MFALLNLGHAKINYVFGTGHPRIIFVIIACLVLGGVIGWIGGRRRAPGEGLDPLAGEDPRLHRGGLARTARRRAASTSAWRHSRYWRSAWLVRPVRA